LKVAFVAGANCGGILKFSQSAHLVTGQAKIKIPKDWRAIAARLEVSWPTTRALDRPEAVVGFDFDGSGGCAAEGHFLKAEG
jgi:hypothetical protein